MEEYKEKTREQEEIQFAYNVFILLLQKIFILGFKLLRFCLYLAILFIEMFLNIIKKLFLQEYDPLSKIRKIKQDRADEQARDYIFRNTKPHATVTHGYEFIRNKIFAKNYVAIEKLLKKCAKHEIEMNQDICKDILKRIDIIIVQSEKQALSEGYKYAKESKYLFENEEIYNKYLENKIMRGEDYKEYNKELLEQFEEGHD